MKDIHTAALQHTDTRSAFVLSCVLEQHLSGTYVRHAQVCRWHAARATAMKEEVAYYNQGGICIHHTWNKRPCWLSIYTLERDKSIKKTPAVECRICLISDFRPCTTYCTAVVTQTTPKSTYQRDYKVRNPPTPRPTNRPSTWSIYSIGKRMNQRATGTGRGKRGARRRRGDSFAFFTNYSVHASGGVLLTAVIFECCGETSVGRAFEGSSAIDKHMSAVRLEKMTNQSGYPLRVLHLYNSSVSLLASWPEHRLFASISLVAACRPSCCCAHECRATSTYPYDGDDHTITQLLCRG